MSEHPTDDFSDIKPPAPPRPQGSGPIHDPWGLGRLGIRPVERRS